MSTECDTLPTFTAAVLTVTVSWRSATPVVDVQRAAAAAVAAAERERERGGRGEQ